MILGLDLGTATGWAMLTQYGAVGSHPDGRPLVGTWALGKQSRPVRYANLDRHLSELLEFGLDTLSLTKVGVEVPGHRSQGHDTKVLLFGLLAVVELACMRFAVPLHLVNETKVKTAVGGHGRAKKDEQVGAVRRKFGLTVHEDEADAIGVALVVLEGGDGDAE